MIGSLPGRGTLENGYFPDEEIPGNKNVVDTPEGETTRPGLLYTPRLQLTLGVAKGVAQKPVGF